MDGLLNSTRAIYREELATALSSVIGEHGQVFVNVRCPDPFSANQVHRFPVVALTQKGVYPFVWIKGTEAKSNTLSSTLEYKLRVLSDRLRLPFSFDVVFVLREATLGGSNTARKPSGPTPCLVSLYQPDTAADNATQDVSEADVIERFTKMFTQENDEAGFEEDVYSELSHKLSELGSGASATKDANTPYFVQDPEKTFRLSLFGGFFGLHRFYLKMYGSGLLYLLTLGLCGAGWFFDCLEILLNVWCKKGKKLPPLPNRKTHAIEFACFSAMLIVIVLVLSCF